MMAFGLVVVAREQERLALLLVVARPGPGTRRPRRRPSSRRRPRWPSRPAPPGRRHAPAVPATRSGRRAGPRPRAARPGPRVARPRTRLPPSGRRAVESRSSLAARSKTPRGRHDPGHEIADGRVVHQVLACRSWSSLGRSSRILSAVLLRATTGFTHGQYELCGHGTAVSVAIEPGGIAARSAVTLAGDEIGERRITDLRFGRGKRLHDSLSLPLRGHRLGYGSAGSAL